MMSTKPITLGKLKEFLNSFPEDMNELPVNLTVEIYQKGTLHQYASVMFNTMAVKKRYTGKDKHGEPVSIELAQMVD